MADVFIAGTGHYAPDGVLGNADLEKILDTSDEWIVTRTGIRERRVAAETQAASDLALPACQDALEQAGLTPHQIELIIMATITPDTCRPGRRP